MARIVFGLGSSHSPMLSTPLENWGYYEDKDRRIPQIMGSPLVDTEGRPATFDELIQRAGDRFAPELTPEKYKARYEACQRSIEIAGEALAKARPDVVLVVGDDQDEQYKKENMPVFGVYYGDTWRNIPPPADHMHPSMRVSAWGYYDDKPTEYRSNAALALHLIGSLIEQQFDVSASRAHAVQDRSMSHAVTYVQRRIMGDGRYVPTIPVFVNTYFPPNQPTVARCMDFGAALRNAVESYKEDMRVAVVASGGLSHFVVDEDLDRTLLDGLRDKDRKKLLALPEARLQSGNSEGKNWISVSAAAKDLEMKVIDYVPVYRTRAGTGCAMGFAMWS